MDGCRYLPEIPNISKDDGSELSGQASDRSRAVEPETIERPDNDSASTSGSSENCSLGSFEIIPEDCIPKPGSEELLNLNNAPPSVAVAISEYVARCWEAPMRVEITNGIWSYFGAFFHDAFSNVDNEEVDRILQEFLNEMSSLTEVLRQRACLVQALYDHCKEIIDAVLVNNIGVALLSFLERRGCINQAESLRLKGKQEDPVAVTRLLFSVMLDRDLKTLLTFVWALRYVSNELFKRISLQFNADIKSSTSAMVLQCLRCILIDRVDICLVADYLLRCRSCNMKKLYDKIIHAQRDESEAIWKELFEWVKLKPSLYAEIRGVIVEAMKDCGFHSDILKRLQAVSNQEKDFDCRCNEAAACNIGTEQTYQVTCCNTGMLKCGAVRTTDMLLEDTNRSTHSASTVTHTEQNEASSEHAASESSMDESNLQMADASRKVNSEDIVCKTNSLKRKNLENEDYRKKKSNFSDDLTSHSEMQANCEKKSCISIVKTATLEDNRSLNHKRISETRCETVSANTEGKCEPVNDDGSNNLKIDELKEAVEIQPDSGVSPGPSLGSFRSDKSDNESDSGCFLENTADRDQTMRKEIATKLSSQEIENPLQNQYAQNVEGIEVVANNLSTIDADHPEDVDLNVNHDALPGALDEPSVDKDGDENATGAIHNIPEQTAENEQSEQTESNAAKEPFINLMIKRNS